MIRSATATTARWRDAVLEADVLPDSVLRWGIRRAIAERLRDERARAGDNDKAALVRFVHALRDAPMAVDTEAANQQHYEVPADFFRLVLGPHLKYSSAYWADGTTSLAEAERAMLEMTVARAQIEDGHRVLDLGCGWGSLSLFLAERCPRSHITAVSNSASQRHWIEQEAGRRGLTNLRVHTANIVHLDLPGPFDRIVSVEMFEHCRNHRALLERVGSWLAPGGALFVHVFSHARYAYLYESHGPSDWMAEHFFTGGMMPADDLLPLCRGALHLEERWRMSGLHYARTARAWLERMDGRPEDVQAVLARTYGNGQVRRWWVRWRIFFMACEELFGYREGREWLVSHYRFRRT